MTYSEYVRSMLDEIIELLIKIGVPSVDGFCQFGNYKLEVAKDKKSFSYWKTADRKNKETTVSDRARILSVSIPDRVLQINIIDCNFPSIRESVWIDGQYPILEFAWIGWNQNEKIKKGALSDLSVWFDETLHLNYQKKNTDGGYLIINPFGIKLGAFLLPQKLEKEKRILGMPFSQKIKFDSKMKKIARISDLEEFLGELRSSANTSG